MNDSSYRKGAFLSAGKTESSRAATHGCPFFPRAHLLTTLWRWYPPASGRALSAAAFFFQSTGKLSVNLTRIGSGVSLESKSEAIQPRLSAFRTQTPCLLCCATQLHACEIKSFQRKDFRYEWVLFIFLFNVIWGKKIALFMILCYNFPVDKSHKRINKWDLGRDYLR